MLLEWARDINPFCKGTGDKHARSAEHQAPLNNQRITKLEEMAQDRIALMDVTRPTF